MIVRIIRRRGGEVRVCSLREEIHTKLRRHNKHARTHANRADMEQQHMNE